MSSGGGRGRPLRQYPYFYWHLSGSICASLKRALLIMASRKLPPEGEKKKEGDKREGGEEKGRYVSKRGGREEDTCVNGHQRKK